jgi:hypothetical protein
MSVKRGKIGGIADASQYRAVLLEHAQKAEVTPGYIRRVQGHVHMQLSRAIRNRIAGVGSACTCQARDGMEQARQ